MALADRVSTMALDRYDLTMRIWATQERKVARVVRRVDEQRLVFIRALFAEMGFRGEELEVRTRIFVVYHSLERAFFAGEDKRTRVRLFKKRLDFFTRP